MRYRVRVRRPPTLVAMFASLVLVATNSIAEDWPHWRGPHQNGVSTSTGVARVWGPEKNVLWRTELPGPAGSTPIVAGDRIFLTTADGEELLLLGFSTDGEELWRRTLSDKNKKIRGDEGNYASASPSIEGDLLVAASGDGQLACYRTTGEPVWRVDLQERYGELNIFFGYTSTPIIRDGRVYLQIIHGDGEADTNEARVACLDLNDGEEIWSTERRTGARGESEHSYASPVFFGSGLDALLLTHGADHTIAYDLVEGKEVWRLGGLNPPGTYHSSFRFVASPAVGGNLIVIPTAKRGPVFGVLPGGIGAITNSDRVLWKLLGRTPDIPSPIVADGYVYLCGEDGALSCIDAQTGEVIYRRRTESDRHRASPVVADGKIYLTSRRGVVTVARTGPDFEILAKNDLGEPMASSPAIANGVLYLRTENALYAIKEVTFTPYPLGQGS
ncbi:Outer membrane protein assembly factor BamB precursor [Pseudobythopirellula maris]|uniref:Outer membrane protein assembly factor BamB n=1 Tax=Pseudobythopirellula maris TaxID=2527991 RepID=A0A5C5ZK71_9BACT|nr:PQQ-binding-like beta-propeller repeat protein [Pseudobythopirellula maris]TWT87447.1 Outer membrane protein assembly factor BamB precursor [Pseudobythopirellula maris]